MTRKKCTKQQSKHVIRIIEIPFEDIVEQDPKNDCLVCPPVGLYYYDANSKKTLKFSAPVADLALLQFVFLDPVIMNHMDAGRLYDFGMGELGGTCAPNYIVKLYQDNKTILTEYDRNYESSGNDRAMCIVVPAELLLTWTED